MIQHFRQNPSGDILSSHGLLSAQEVKDLLEKADMNLSQNAMQAEEFSHLHLILLYSKQIHLLFSRRPL